jgi:phage gp36-like protein
VAYTTAEQVKRELSFNYEKSASKKLTEDGYINAAGTFDESLFLNFFVNQTATFIDGYLAGTVGTPPFAYNGVLDKINKSLSVYEVEMYLISATVDRVVSVSIYAMYQWAMKMLDKILAGEISLLPVDASLNSGTVQLIEPEYDGATIQIGELEENIFFGGSADSERIPE